MRRSHRLFTTVASALALTWAGTAVAPSASAGPDCDPLPTPLEPGQLTWPVWEMNWLGDPDDPVADPMVPRTGVWNSLGEYQGRMTTPSIFSIVESTSMPFGMVTPILNTQTKATLCSPPMRATSGPQTRPPTLAQKP